MDTLIPDGSAALKTVLAGMAGGARTWSRGDEGATPFEAKILIPGQPARISTHYSDLVRGPLDTMSRAAGQNPPQPNFGLLITFGEPTEVRVYDEDLVLDETLRRVIGEFGTLMLRNAFMPGVHRAEGLQRWINMMIEENG